MSCVYESIWICTSLCLICCVLFVFVFFFIIFFFQAEDGIRDLVRSRGLGDVYKRQDSKRKPDEFTPAYARNGHRSIKPEILVAVGICPHLGLSLIHI